MVLPCVRHATHGDCRPKSCGALRVFNCRSCVVEISFGFQWCLSSVALAAHEKMMKRRQRANSVEADLQDLGQLHDSIRRNQAAIGVVVTDESHARRAVDAQAKKAAKRITVDFEAGLKDLEAKRAKADQRAKPPPMVAAMGDLFLKSRAQDREAKEAEERARVAERHAAIEKYKHRQRRMLEKSASTRAAEDAQRYDFISEERVRRRAALDFSRQQLNDQRSKTVMGMTEARDERRSKRLGTEAEIRNATRSRIDADKECSRSPSLFLQLPPLFHHQQTVVNTSTISGGNANTTTGSSMMKSASRGAGHRASTSFTELAVLRRLRDDEAVRHTPLPDAEKRRTLGHEPNDDDPIIGL